MAAMWEVAILHALSGTGSLRYEAPLESGKEPDIELDTGALRITADVVCVSDEGLDGNNPYRGLSDAIEQAKTKLGLPIGGLYLRVESKRTVTPRGTKTILRLPPRNRIRSFVGEEVVPELRDQLRAGETILRIAIDDQAVGIEITIDPAKSPISGGSFAAYDIPGIKDRNPLYGALERKAAQLRGAGHLTGIIAGDGDTKAMAPRRSAGSGFSAGEIVQEFFRQYSPVDFVFLLTAEEEQSFMPAQDPIRRLLVSTHYRDGCPQVRELEALSQRMMERLPNPAMMPVNGALRAREQGYDIGHHGGYTVSGSALRVSLREMTEVLAGLRTFDDGGAKYVEAARRLASDRRRNPLQAAIQRNLVKGRLPVSMKVISGDEDDSDGWVEIEFGDPDPAISPLR